MSDLNRIKWRCRRGLQEMDIALSRFLDQCYPSLNDEQGKAFERLLDEADLDILNWIFERDPTPGHYVELVDMIRKSFHPSG